MHTRRDDLQAMRQRFAQAPFVAHLGIQLLALEPGICLTELVIAPWMLQQAGIVHAGVQTTLADHTAGAAAYTTAPPGHTIVTADIQMRLLRPARCARLRCRAEVIRPGRQASYVEASVYALDGEREVLVARAGAGMAVLSEPA
ncbi:MAG: PaaI family thioesterase [Xanthomonadales bacterium]|nr:hypothetical protein [Xanthomonadales bacterium]MCC6592191.1 PaaI family thioesterase [Xanthomonadales bacterium]MCE7932367.1 PaaI family thioesterase [Xanthomonadales bacterium PRO6]